MEQEQRSKSSHGYTPQSDSCVPLMTTERETEIAVMSGGNITK